MGPLLRVRDLHLYFRLFEGTAHVLNGLNLEVRRGEKVAIVGESGCGKSVTLRIMLGLLQLRHAEVRGSIQFEGRELNTVGERGWKDIRGKQISMVFQDPMAALNPVFTVEDQLAAVIRRGFPRKNRRDVYQRAREVLLQVAISDPDRVLKSYPFQLSGGLNQRILIAMALVNSPKLILADEPGTALDVTVQEQTLRLMRKLVEDSGTAVLLITHNLGVVREFADRVYVMYAGSIVEEASVEELFAAPKHPYTQALLEAVPRLSGKGLPKGIEGVVPDYTKPPSGCRFHPRCPHVRPRCREVAPVVEVAEGHRVACVLYEEVPVRG